MNMKKTLCTLLAALVLTGGGAAMTGCTQTDETQTGMLTVTDQAGREVTLDKPAEKLVSSYYISTALLVALGCEDNLCGIEMKADTRELYRLAAPQLLDLPAVGSGKGINVEETAALSPDLVILPARLADSILSFEELGIPVLVVNPETQADFEACVTLLAEVTGKTERGEALLDYYQGKMAEAAELTAELERPTVYMASSGSYLRTCTDNMYQSDLIEVAGGTCVSAELTDGYWTEVSAEQVLAWNPEYIFSVQGADYTLEDIRHDTALSEVSAVKDGNLSVFPSEIEAWDYPTPSSVLGVLWLTHQLHPEVYTKEQYVSEAQNFYRTYFDIDVTEAQLGLE